MTARSSRARAWRLGGLLARLRRSTGGVSAVEFAIVAPFLVMGTFTMVDVGMAVYEKMMINQVLRAGAQPAFEGADEGEVLSVLEQTASDNFSVAGGDAQGDELALDVTSYCACPGGAVVQVACTSVCGSGAEAFRFYRLTAAKTFQGIMLPEFTLSGALEVMSQ